MIPIRDLNQTRRTPVVTWALIAANVLIFVGSLSLGQGGSETFVMRFGVIPDVMVNGSWTLPRAAGGAFAAPYQPMTFCGALRVGIGIATYPDNGENIEALLRKLRMWIGRVGAVLGALNLRDLITVMT